MKSKALLTLGECPERALGKVLELEGVRMAYYINACTWKSLGSSFDPLGFVTFIKYWY